MAQAPTTRTNNSTTAGNTSRKNHRQLEEECKILSSEHDQMGRALIDAEVRLVDARLALGRIVKPLERWKDCSGDLDAETKNELLQALSDAQKLNIK